MHDLCVQFHVLIHVITMSSALGSDMDVHAREVELQPQVELEGQVQVKVLDSKLCTQISVIILDRSYTF